MKLDSMKSRPAQESLAPSFLSTVRWNIRGVQRRQKNHWRLSRCSVGATTDRVIAEGGGGVGGQSHLVVVNELQSQVSAELRWQQAEL